MSRGLQGIYELIDQNETKVSYAYGGMNLSHEFDKVIYEQQDGKIEIDLDVFGNEEVFSFLNSEKIRFLEKCAYAECNSEGQDIFAIYSTIHILKQYIREGQIPTEGAWLR